MIRILIALQGRLYAEGIRRILRNSTGMRVAGVSDCGDGLYALAERTRPAVVLTDVKTLRYAFPEGAPAGSRVIVIGSEEDDLADLILNGTVFGALRESSGPATMEAAIRAVAMGVVWMEGAWPGRIREHAGLKAAIPDPLHG